jgi:hypothetical protein
MMKPPNSQTQGFPSVDNCTGYLYYVATTSMRANTPKRTIKHPIRKTPQETSDEYRETIKPQN